MQVVIVILIILIFSLLVIFLKSNADNRKREDEEAKVDILCEIAKVDYFDSLVALKSNPNDPELKQQTLAKGRDYSALTRELYGQNKTVTVFDEIALMNDINAACAGAAVVSEKIKNSSILEERLAKLSELKKKNLISEEEYETRRQKILDEI